jgi:hypothetical protein
MAQAVSQQTLTTEAWFHSQAVHVGYMLNKMALGQVFLQVRRPSRVSVIPPAIHTPTVFI